MIVLSSSLRRLGLGGAALFLFYSSCTQEPDNIVALPEVCFQKDVLPLFQTNCAISGCHNSTSKVEGLVFDSYETIRAGGITPYEPNKSKAYQVMHAEYMNMMPPSGPLSREQRTLIRLWIEQGAPNTQCDDDGNIIDDGTVCYARDVAPILISNCAKSGCHDAASREEGVDYSTYATTFTTGGIVAGNAAASKLIRSVTASPGSEDFMPPAPHTPLTAQQIDILRTWINEGAKNRTCTTNCDPELFAYNAQIKPIIDSYCKGCHSGSSPDGGIRLETHAQTKVIADNGKLVGSIKGSPGFIKMPPGAASLTACEITQIEKWAQAGAPNN